METSLVQNFNLVAADGSLAYTNDKKYAGSFLKSSKICVEKAKIYVCVCVCVFQL